MHTRFIYRMLRETFDLMHCVRHFIFAQLIIAVFVLPWMAQE